MNKLWVGVAVGVGVLAVGLVGGYWHFAGILAGRQAALVQAPTPQREAPALQSGTAPTSPEVDVAAPSSAEVQVAAEPVTTVEPSLELLRVEPDGSAVFAGRAAPESAVEIRSGDTVLAQEAADASGDFVVTLDEPLPVGDHELTLRTTAPDGTAAVAPEVAIVSVPPAGREGDLLVALGSSDGPTRVLQTPDAPAGQPGPASQGAAESPDAAEPAAPVAEATIPAIASAEVPLRGSAGLAIGAVEIEGDRMYVAGTSRSGRTIRIYLDDEFVADAHGTGDQFIAEAIASVPVGSHVVRADEIGTDGRVVTRVEVPFERPEGESMAALAPGFGRAAPGSGEALSTPEAPAAADASREAAAARPATTPYAPAVPATPADAPAEAPTVVAEGSAAPRAGQPAEFASQDASSPPSSLSSPAAADDASDTAPAPSTSTAAGPASPPIASEAPSSQSAVAPGAGGQSSSQASAGATDEPASRQAALQPVEGRVIIRRGDTLWRISRETYGLGRRYTTIYLANGDQIRDPDLIYPGQIFRLPEEADGDAVR